MIKINHSMQCLNALSTSTIKIIPYLQCLNALLTSATKIIPPVQCLSKVFKTFTPSMSKQINIETVTDNETGGISASGVQIMSC